MIAVQHLTGEDGVELLVGLLAPRHRDEPVQVRADHLGLAALLARALQAFHLALELLADGLGEVQLVGLLAVGLLHAVVVVAELALDGGQLLAQEVLALLLVGARLDVVTDLATDLQRREALALHLEREREALGDVDRLEDADLLLEGQVRGVTGGVGQRTGLADRADPPGDPTVVAADLQELLDHGAVLALELAGAAVDGCVVGGLGDLDVELAVRSGLGGADDAAGLSGELRAATAAGKADRLDDRGDRADGGVLALVAGDEDDALGVADVEGQRDVHRGQDDGVVERDEEICGRHASRGSFVDFNRCVSNCSK